MVGARENGGPRILVVGYNAWDLIMPVSFLPEPDEKLEVPWMLSCGGGPGATAAVALAKLGAGVRFLTPLTDDLPGRLQLQELQAAGVDTSPSPVIPGYESPRAVILVDRECGDRTILWSRGNVPHLDAGRAEEDLLLNTDLLYLDGHEPAVSLPLARMARDRRIPVVMDAGSVREGSAELVACCSDVLGSRRFASDLTGRSHPLAALRALRRMGPARVGTTFGREGVIGLAGDRPLAVPAYDVPVTDTTGAGDAFHAGYAFALALGLVFPDCLDWGCAVAGLKCGGWGGRRALPDRPGAAGLVKDGPRVSSAPLLARLDPGE